MQIPRTFAGVGIIANGILFETNSFSPFILGWIGEDEQNSGVSAKGNLPPKAGDNADLALWRALVVLSAAGVALILRRRKGA